MKSGVKMAVGRQQINCPWESSGAERCAGLHGLGLCQASGTLGTHSGARSAPGSREPAPRAAQGARTAVGKYSASSGDGIGYVQLEVIAAAAAATTLAHHRLR